MAKADNSEIAILPMVIASAITVEFISISHSGGAPAVEMPSPSTCA